MQDAATPRTEAEIRAYTVGEVVPYGQKVVVVDYDPGWPERYDREAERVEAALGGRVMGLWHVGSTSVPGLAAKPVVDMVLSVADSADEAAYVPDLVAAGFVLRIREPDWYEHRVLKGPGVDVNLHIFTVGCPEIARMLAFRDWLRVHLEDRDRYASAKRDLAGREWKYVQNYADAKTPVIQEIMARATGSAAGPG